MKKSKVEGGILMNGGTGERLEIDKVIATEKLE